MGLPGQQISFFFSFFFSISSLRWKTNGAADYREQSCIISNKKKEEKKKKNTESALWEATHYQLPTSPDSQEKSPSVARDRFHQRSQTAAAVSNSSGWKTFTVICLVDIDAATCPQPECFGVCVIHKVTTQLKTGPRSVIHSLPTGPEFTTQQLETCDWEHKEIHADVSFNQCLSDGTQKEGGIVFTFHAQIAAMQTSSLHCLFQQT